jgi:hypothetical protein
VNEGETLEAIIIIETKNGIGLNQNGDRRVEEKWTFRWHIWH